MKKLSITEAVLNKKRVFLDLELECIKKKKKGKNPRDFSKHIVWDGQMEFNLNHKCAFI